jgi:hypothetical protein
MRPSSLILFLSFFLAPLICAAAIFLTTAAFSGAARAQQPVARLPVAPVSDAPASPGASATGTKSTKDAVDFAIVIPAVLRLLENNHPTRLHAPADSAAPVSALQRVVLVSTLRSGFCMDLRLNPLPADQAPVTDWQVQLAAPAGTSNARIDAFDGGWRVCTGRAGRYELALLHAFSFQPTARLIGPDKASEPAATWGWPVALSLSAL